MRDCDAAILDMADTIKLKTFGCKYYPPFLKMNYIKKYEDGTTKLRRYTMPLHELQEKIDRGCEECNIKDIVDNLLRKHWEMLQVVPIESVQNF